MCVEQAGGKVSAIQTTAGWMTDAQTIHSTALEQVEIIILDSTGM